MRIDFLRSIGRFFVQVDIGNPNLGSRIAIGRWPKGETLAKLSDYRTRMADEYAADDVPHPFADPDALTGNVTTPAGAQSGEVIDVTKGPYVPNWPSNEDGS